MYAFVDRPLAQLDAASRLLVWAMRSWVEAVGRRQCPGFVIGTAFARHNMIAGIQPFLRMMAGLNRGGLENLEFCRLACNHVSEHEAILLQLVSDARSQEVVSVRDTLSILVEEDYVGDLFEAVVRLGDGLGRASGSP
ncbi:hypothetical protein B0I00_3329 [Novosphingobium kunmingense]|uniref:Uncharacterized protein n=1 Tax=Novosphingobium kunmingense TaxID=1211806 RepID=A0A2N0H3L0_9SPHN|nr:hypothetical protein [Novosphingobium kunmingense]PKB13524.1 hypothetical protein B0I00_3329 [Novosphingobium kunmingense]